MATARFVCSTENTPYMAWQAKLFAYSCHKQGIMPLVVVHESVEGAEKGLHPDYLDISRKRTAEILLAPSYRGYMGYPCRNLAGTLTCASLRLKDSCDFIVMTDQDMIFTGIPRLPGSLSGDFTDTVDYNDERIMRIAKENSLTVPEDFSSLQVGAPYVFPTPTAQEFARTWLWGYDIMDSGPHVSYWMDGMFAYGYACLKLGLIPENTYQCQSNFIATNKTKGPIIHYCFGFSDGDKWDKRSYRTQEEAASVWKCEQVFDKGTVGYEIINQIQEAGKFYAN